MSESVYEKLICESALEGLSLLSLIRKRELTIQDLEIKPGKSVCGFRFGIPRNQVHKMLRGNYKFLSQYSSGGLPYTLAQYLLFGFDSNYKLYEISLHNLSSVPFFNPAEFEDLNMWKKCLN